MSYTIEVFRGHQKAERNFGIYSLYVMFYPQLVAGPIERPQNLLHQFYKKHEFDYKRVVEGLKLMLWGFFMKLVVADRLAVYVNAVYNNPEQHHGGSFILATVFFAFQIYCDFAGYSNIAIGSAKVMGFNLMTNFRRPYFSTSISEFWKRWHISLSTWFKDYLYISLGGNRVPIPRWYFNLFFVFAVSGLWHGANWTYIIWGALNGFYLVFALISQGFRSRLGSLVGLNRLPKLNHLLQLIITFSLVCFAWIFFRANSLNNAIHIVREILKLDFTIFIDKIAIGYSLLAIILLTFIELRQEIVYKSDLPIIGSWKITEYGFYAILIILILSLGVFDGSQFIYFQF